MGKKLYIGGIPYSTTVEALQAYFAQAGQIESCVIITDKYTGRSKGFGFVEYVNEADAQKAIEMFHGKEFEGRVLTVSEARPLKERAPRTGGYNSDPMGSN